MMMIECKSPKVLWENIGILWGDCKIVKVRYMNDRLKSVSIIKSK